MDILGKNNSSITHKIICDNYRCHSAANIKKINESGNLRY